MGRRASGRRRRYGHTSALASCFAYTGRERDLIYKNRLPHYYLYAGPEYPSTRTRLIAGRVAANGNWSAPARPAPSRRHVLKKATAAPHTTVPQTEQAELGELAELGDGFSLVEDEFTIPETKDSGPTKFEVVTTSSGWYGLRLHERDYLITKNRRDFYHWLNSEYATNSEFLDFSLTFNSTKPHRPDRSTLW